MYSIIFSELDRGIIAKVYFHLTPFQRYVVSEHHAKPFEKLEEFKSRLRADEFVKYYNLEF